VLELIGVTCITLLRELGGPQVRQWKWENETVETTRIARGFLGHHKTSLTKIKGEPASYKGPLQAKWQKITET